MARCKLCGKPIEWVQYSDTGRWVPIDAGITEIGERAVKYFWTDGDFKRYEGPARGQTCHLNTCEKSVNNQKLARLRGENDGDNIKDRAVEGAIKKSDV